VRTAKREGADFVKVYQRLSRETFLAIADESKKQGLPFAGHVPNSVSAREASDAGMKSIEHLTGVLLASSSREDELRAFAADPTAAPPEEQTRRDRLIRDTYSREKEAALLQRFKRNHTWQTPTLIVSRNGILGVPVRDDPRLKYVPAFLKTIWQQQMDGHRQRPAERAEFLKWNYERLVDTVGMMHQARVDLLAGTDAFNPYCFPGFSLHDELELLVGAGLTAADALRAATIDPARFLGKEAEMGSVSKGKIADVVLLDADPLKDIRNTKRIHAVFFQGKLYERQALDKMLSDVAATAASSQPAAH
jgi:imidazolonepropionase-like amidohydrolase